MNDKSRFKVNITITPCNKWRPWKIAPHLKSLTHQQSRCVVRTLWKFHSWPCPYLVRTVHVADLITENQYLGSRTRLERWFYLSNAPLSCIPYCVGNHSGIIIWFVFLVGIYASFFWIYIIWHFLSKIIIYILLSYLLDEMVVSKVNLRFIVLQAISWR